MTSREWWVQVSLDDLSDSLDQLETTEERGQWLEGFRVGSRGHASREDWPRFKRMGFDFGLGCHEEAVEFRAKKAGAGKASVEARKAKYGSASPNSVRAVFEHASEQSTERHPEQTPNQPTTNNQQLTKNRKQRATTFSAEAEKLYLAYPKKADPVKAKQAIENALKTASFDSLMAAVQAYASSREGEDPHYTKHPSGWFNDCRYLDDPSTWIKTTKQSKNGVKHDGFAKTDYFAGLEDLPTGD